MKPYQFGWLSTGRDKAARDLLTTVYNSIQRGEIKAEIAFVFCNRQPGEAEESDLFIKLVKDYQISLVCFSSQQFKDNARRQSGSLSSWRSDFDREVIKRLQRFSPDIYVLAGYMMIMSKEMCLRYDMINLHPAAPGGPAGTWQEVIWQLIANKAQQTGLMMHLVTPELDSGQVVAYATFSIRGKPFDRYWEEVAKHPLNEIQKTQGENNPLFKLIREHGLAREFPLIIATLKAFSQGKIKVTVDKKVVDAEGRPIIGYNLTDEIDVEVRGKLP
ncbi:MAG: phosphoglycerate transporter [Chloroflexi bacterium]|nr:phosphoglycerate transporter [Chloroflexota bacterium]